MISTPDRALTAYLESCLGPLEPVEHADHEHELVGPDAVGRWSVRVDGELVEAPGSRPRAVALLLWSLNRAVIASRSGTVLLHAGGVHLDGVTVLLPGDMEVGKTTLVAGLLRAGASYLSDEAIELRPDGRIEGFGKALSLDPGSWALFPELEPTVPAAVRGWLPEQWQVDPRTFGGEVLRRSRADLLLLPRYEAGAATGIGPALPGGEALVRLASAVFPTELPRREVLGRLAGLLDHAPCHELTVGSLDLAVDRVRRELADMPRRGRGDGDAVPRGTSPVRTTAPQGHHVGTTAIDVRGERVLHVARTDELLLLNRIGEVVWDRLTEGWQLDAIVADLVARTGGEPAEVASEVDRFVHDLEARGAIDRTTDPGAAAPPRDR